MTEWYIYGSFSSSFALMPFVPFSLWRNEDIVCWQWLSVPPAKLTYDTLGQEFLLLYMNVTPPLPLCFLFYVCILTLCVLHTIKKTWTPCAKGGGVTLLYTNCVWVQKSNTLVSRQCSGDYNLTIEQRCNLPMLQ